MTTQDLAVPTTVQGSACRSSSGGSWCQPQTPEAEHAHRQYRRRAILERNVSSGAESPSGYEFLGAGASPPSRDAASSVRPP